MNSMHKLPCLLIVVVVIFGGSTTADADLVFPDGPDPTDSIAEVEFETLDLSFVRQIEIDIRSETEFDRFVWLGTGDGQLSLGGTLLIDWIETSSGSEFFPTRTTSFQLFTFGSVVGSFDRVCFDSELPVGAVGEFDNQTGVLTISVVPEPSAFLLLGLVGLAVTGWKRFSLLSIFLQTRDRMIHGAALR